MDFSESLLHLNSRNRAHIKKPLAQTVDFQWEDIRQE
jgi:hypothetical protein